MSPSPDNPDEQHTSFARAGEPSSTGTAGVTTAPADPSPLHLEDLTISAGELTLLRDVTLTIAAGKITVIVGASGAGKSVLLRTLAGLIPRDGNELQWQGEIRLGDEPQTSDSGRQRVGIVFQQFALFDELSPIANVQFAIDHRRNRNVAPSQSAAEWLDELGVPKKTRVAGLSGGQKQRLAIARTLAADPSIVLYDEPTSGLDSASGGRVADLIRRTHLAHQRTSIVVSHDYETLIPIADEVLLLDSETGKLVEIPRDQWSEIPSRMKPAHDKRPTNAAPKDPSDEADSSRGIDQPLRHALG